MYRNTLLATSAVFIASLFGGCVGTGPNTQQGAVTGGALGALAGAVIGHNSRGGDSLGGALIGGTVGAIAGGTIGNSVDQQNGTVYGAHPYHSHVGYYSAPPPAPQPVAETVPASPNPNAVWIPGYWDFNGTGYAWVSGRWEIPPADVHQYVSPHWEDRSGTYVFVRGYWR